MFFEFHLNKKPYSNCRLFTSLLGHRALPENDKNITVLPMYDAHIKPSVQPDSPDVHKSPRTMYPVLFGESRAGPFTLYPLAGGSQKAFAPQEHIVCGKTPALSTPSGFFDGDHLYLNPQTSHLLYLGSTVPLS